jgi:hypothetical protein
MTLRTTLVRLFCAAMLSGPALGAADDDMERVAPVTHGPTAEECGECHMAYQPALLPRESWVGIMRGLADHFDEDAALPDALVAEIEAYLIANAGRGDVGVLRITRQRWWIREHRKLSQADWSRPQVRTRSNCPACHLGAERGTYDDD